MFGVFCPHIWECGSKRVNPVRTAAVPFFGDKLLRICLDCPQDGTAVLKASGLGLLVFVIVPGTYIIAYQVRT